MTQIHQGVHREQRAYQSCRPEAAEGRLIQGGTEIDECVTISIQGERGGEPGHGESPRGHAEASAPAGRDRDSPEQRAGANADRGQRATARPADRQGSQDDRG